jgi:hypothetical protein
MEIMDIQVPWYIYFLGILVLALIYWFIKEWM